MGFFGKKKKKEQEAARKKQEARKQARPPQSAPQRSPETKQPPTTEPPKPAPAPVEPIGTTPTAPEPPQPVVSSQPEPTPPLEHSSDVKPSEPETKTAPTIESHSSELSAQEKTESPVSEEEITSDIDPDALHVKEKQIEDLMTLDGIGRKRAEKLWNAGFRSAEEVAGATVDELIMVEGFSKKIAEAVKVNIDDISFDDDIETASEMDSDVVSSSEEVEDGDFEDISAVLLQWSVDGFDVSELEAIAQEDRDENFMRLYERTSEAIEEIEKIQNSLEDMNILDLDAEFKALVEVLHIPSRIEDTMKRYHILRSKASIRDAVHELKPLEELESLAPRVKAVLARINAGEYNDTLKTEISEIKRLFKEESFMMDFQQSISSAPPLRMKKAPIMKKVVMEPEARKLPMEVEDIFLMHKNDYRLINHVTNRVVGDTEKQELFMELKAIRSFVRHNDKFKPEDLNIIRFGDKIAIMLQGDQTLLSMVIKGDVNIWAKKLIAKVLSMIEQEEADVLRTWDGDPSKLPGTKKNMTALMYACVRLGKQGGDAQS